MCIKLYENSFFENFPQTAQALCKLLFAKGLFVAPQAGLEPATL